MSLRTHGPEPRWSRGVLRSPKTSLDRQNSRVLSPTIPVDSAGSREARVHGGSTSGPKHHPVTSLKGRPFHLEQAGLTVTGTALAARAATELETSAGIPSTTLARLLTQLDAQDRHGAPGPWRPGRHVLVVDEAGMIGTRQLARLLAHAQRRDVKVVLVGDPHQLPEIQAGGLFRALATRLPAIELHTNRRQHAPWERDALDQLRDGHIPDAIGAYLQHGRITATDTAEAAREALVADWWDAFAQHGPRAVMIGLRRAEVDDLNRRARARLTAACFNVLAAILDHAVRHGVIIRSVARGVELPRTAPATRRFLTAPELARLAGTIDPVYRTLVLILGYSGIRFGEAVALRRRACDLLRRQLRIVESATEVGGELSWGLPKTHRQRAVSLPRFVTEALAEHLDQRVPASTDALVFTSDLDGPLRHGRFLRTFWQPAVAAANMPEGLTPHELRHTAASLLIASGAGPKSVQGQLGHSTITTTFDTYGHLFEGHLDDVMDRLDADWRRNAG